jgi:hypothetical protein
MMKIDDTLKGTYLIEVKTHFTFGVSGHECLPGSTVEVTQTDARGKKVLLRCDDESDWVPASLIEGLIKIEEDTKPCKK